MILPSFCKENSKAPKNIWMIGRLYIPFQVAFAVGFMDGTVPTFSISLALWKIPWKFSTTTTFGLGCDLPRGDIRDNRTDLPVVAL